MARNRVNGCYEGLIEFLPANRNELEREQEPFAWDYKAWRRAFNDPIVLDALSELHTRPNNRATLYQLAAEIVFPDGRAVLRLFVWSQVWGHGRVGYGPWRVRRILNQHRATAALIGVFKLVREQGTLAAYSAMGRGGPHNIRGLGQAFATKYLHFAGYGHVASGPQPLVLDALVGCALREGEPGLFGRCCGQEWCLRDYSRYIMAVDAIATSGPLAGVEPRAVELALFRIGDGLRDPNRVGPNNNQA